LKDAVVLPFVGGDQDEAFFVFVREDEKGQFLLFSPFLFFWFKEVPPPYLSYRFE